MKKYVYPTMLIVLFIILTAVILPSDAIYGSNTDWLSQHAVLAETIRDACVEQHTLLPDWINLGSGSNGYQFSYYGFLRPDILIGCLFPQIPMVSILIGYMFFLYLAAILLCYVWLRSEEIPPSFALIGSILFLTAGCLFHMHRQIMFVNYLPFLILAFLCIKKQRFRFLPLCMLLICLHSFYFAIAAFAAIGWYWLRLEGISFWKHSFFKKYLPSAVLSICMSAALLLPTGLVLIEHRRNGGGFSLFKLLELFGPNVSMNNILFNEYGLGLTLICFYTILAGLNRKNPAKKNFFADSVLFLSFGLFGFFSYILNGTLYARPKILIPFLPLFILHCIRYLKSAHAEKHTTNSGSWYPLYPFAVMLPIGLLWFSQIQFPWILTELCLLFLFCLIQRRKRTPDLQRLKNLCISHQTEMLVYLLVLIAPIGMYITTASKENWVKRSALSSDSLSEEAANVPMDPRYHFDSLVAPLASGNETVTSEMTRSSMYSSVTNSAYSDLYYDILMTPIGINNRVALLTADNPFMLRLLGVRYIETEKDHIPFGYTPLCSTAKDTIIAENKNVLPNVYFTSDTISEENFDRLSKIEQPEALFQKTVISNQKKTFDASTADHSSGFSSDSSAESFKPQTFITPFSPKLSISGALPESLDIKKTSKGYEIISKCKQSLTFSIDNTGNGSILLLSFEVKNKTFQPVVIDINKIRNKLSGTFAPYPNGNNTFHYQLSTDKDAGSTKMHVTIPKGHFTISHVQWYSCSEQIFNEKNVSPASMRRTAEGKEKQNFLSGTTVFSGTFTADQDGILATSIPCQNGLELLIDGKQADIIRINKAFAGAAADKGTHLIEIRFSPPGKTVGCIISFAALSLYLCRLILSFLHFVLREKSLTITSG